MSIEKTISNLVENQFPEFYREEGPVFVTFVKKYYEWMEQTGNPLFYSRHAPEFSDIDKTAEEFLVYFKEEYLKNIQLSTETDTRQMVKHALDLYRSRGNERAVDLLFRLVFGVGAKLYYPSTDLFKLSDGRWVRPTYLEVTLNDHLEQFVGKQITGLTSGATAFCTRIIRRFVGNRFSDIIYINNIRGKFLTDEKINITYSPIDVEDCPTITGSLNYVDISTNGTGSGFEIGQIVDISSVYGRQGLGRVSEISDIAGAIFLTLDNGGYGYSNTAEVLISDSVMTLANVTVTANINSPTFLLDYENYIPLFSQIQQPHALINYISANNNFNVGDIVYTYHANNDIKGIGTIFEITSSTVSNGTIRVAINSGNLQSNTFYVTGNTVAANQATVNGYIQITYSANVMGISPTVNLYVTGYTTAFNVGEVVYQKNSSNTVTANGSLTKITINGSNTIFSINSGFGAFITGEPIFGLASNSSANAASLEFKIGVLDGNGYFSNSIYNVFNAPASNLSGTITRKSTGENASFTIDPDLIYVEYINYNTDLIQPYLAIALDSTGYGFPGNPDANLTNGTILDALTYANVQIGKINRIVQTAIGSDYDEVPFVRVFEPQTYTGKKQDLIIQISNLTSSFISNELITQDATGARGIVKPNSNSSVLYVESLNYANNPAFVVTSNTTTFITGFESGSIANATSVVIDIATEYIGFNAQISANLASGNGAVTKLDVIDSGFGFLQNEEVTFANGALEGMGYANLQTHGTARGFYEQKGGFLSDQKKLFDGYYYQDFSYEVRSSIELNKYSEMLKQILHIAGTQNFSRLMIDATAQIEVGVTAADIEIEEL